MYFSLNYTAFFTILVIYSALNSEGSYFSILKSSLLYTV